MTLNLSSPCLYIQKISVVLLYEKMMLKNLSSIKNRHFISKIDQAFCEKKEFFWSRKTFANSWFLSLQNVWGHYNNLFGEWNIKTIFQTECSVDSIKHTVLLRILLQIFLLVSIKSTVHWKFSRQKNFAYCLY